MDGTHMMSSSNAPPGPRRFDRETSVLTHGQANIALGEKVKRIDEIVYGLTDAIQAGRVSERFANLSVRVRV